MKRFLLLSGWGYCSSSMSSIASRINSNFEMLSVHSINRGDGYVAGLIDKINSFSEPPCVIAWSMGAIVALEAALNDRCSISRLVLLAGTPCFCNTNSWKFGLSRQRLVALKRKLKKTPWDTMMEFFSKRRD